MAANLYHPNQREAARTLVALVTAVDAGLVEDYVAIGNGLTREELLDVVEAAVANLLGAIDMISRVKKRPVAEIIQTFASHYSADS